MLRAGPRLIGLLFNWSLLGVLTTQVYIYHVNFPKDKRLLKVLVYGIYLLDWAQTCSATYDAFQWFVYGWGDVPMLYLRYTGFLNVPLLSSIIGALVQVFYGWRIWVFGQSRVLFGVICLLALLQLGGGIATAYYMFMNAVETARSSGMVRAVGVRLAGSALVDTVISTSMTYFVGYSDRHIVVRLTVETGTITVVMAIVDLVFYLKEHNGLHQVSGVVLCKLYSNTLLVLFNNRLGEWNKTRQAAARSADTAVTFRVDRSTTVDDFTLATMKSDKDFISMEQTS
ncbi:hypothetical protein K438DRAFT_2136689 [Mycena galopus ATCC 62051]|nr:hypothetical protein K438DRAFT_2136689 [Mycena galopus ATCC 62051]